MFRFPSTSPRERACLERDLEPFRASDPAALDAPALLGRLDALGEVVERTVSDSSSQTLTERNLKPAAQPKVDIQSFAEGKDRISVSVMNAAIDTNGLDPLIDRVFPFEQAADAYAYLTSQAHIGKVVIAH